jgi:acetolactate synthase-1/2/3 large subunit
LVAGKNIPFVTTWNSLSYIHEYKSNNYLGSIGVYGSRLANTAVNRCSHLLVLGSRLDNRQRSSSPKIFAPNAQIFVIDIDIEELKKYENLKKYSLLNFDLRSINFKLLSKPHNEKIIMWTKEIESIKNQITDGRDVCVNKGKLSPYSVMDFIFNTSSFKEIIVADCGANLCWTYQSFKPFGGLIFTAGGNSPMGYSLPASIGAYYSDPDKNIICVIGDGGIQINIQELQTISNNKIPIKMVILNNNGFGIIKQFQDTYFNSRYAASGDGYSTPDFSKIANAYNIEYIKIETVDELQTKFKTKTKHPVIYDVIIPENALITPKLEMGHEFDDQFPYNK